MAWDTSATFKLPWQRASTTARSQSLRPLQFSMIQPLASSGKVTPDFLEHRLNTSCARAHHCLSCSPSRAFSANTSATFSPIWSSRSFSGQRLSRRSKMTFSPPALWYSSSSRCSTTSRAGPWRSVHRNDPRESSASLSIVRILLTAHNFHRRYSLQSQSSPEKYRSEAPNSPMALIFRDPCHLTLAQHSPTYRGTVKTPGALLAPLPMLVAGRTPRAAFSLHMGQKSLRHVPPFDLALILHIYCVRLCWYDPPKIKKNSQHRNRKMFRRSIGWLAGHKF